MLEVTFTLAVPASKCVTTQLGMLVRVSAKLTVKMVPTESVPVPVVIVSSPERLSQTWLVAQTTVPPVPICAVAPAVIEVMACWPAIVVAVATPSAGPVKVGDAACATAPVPVLPSERSAADGWLDAGTPDVEIVLIHWWVTGA